MVCSQCQTEVPDGAIVCSQCGALLATAPAPASQEWSAGSAGPPVVPVESIGPFDGPAAPAGPFVTGDATTTYSSGGPAPGGPVPGTPLPGAPLPGAPMPGAAPAPARARAATPPVQFAMNRLTQSDRITAVASLVLLISLFLPWFRASANTGILGVSASATGSGVTAHGYLYIVLILCLAILGLVLLRAAFATAPFVLPGGHELLLLAATSINLLLVLIAFIFKPGGYASVAYVIRVGWSWGAFVALVAAVVAVAPLALPMIQARRAKA